MYLIFDTETTGLPKNYEAALTDFDNWPRLVQLAWQVHDEDGNLIKSADFLVKPAGFSIPFNAEKVHGISTEMAAKSGRDLAEVLAAFSEDLKTCRYICGHNIEFDIAVTACEMHRLSMAETVTAIPAIDTKIKSTEYCKIPGGKGGGFKWPRLDELYLKLFGETFSSAHNASADVAATARCFFEMMRLGLIGTAETGLDREYFTKFTDDHADVIAPYNTVVKSQQVRGGAEKVVGAEKKGMANAMTDRKALEEAFVHLHCHSHFSILQATCGPEDLVQNAVECGMKALAITDRGNMYGAFKFHRACLDQGILPVIGCEFYICTDRKNKNAKDDGYGIVLLARNKEGYANLCRLSAISFQEGFYYVPRIDREALEAHCNGLIALSGGMRGEVNQLLLNEGESKAEASLLWYHKTFGEDFYLEVVRHKLEEESVCNEFLLRCGEKFGISVIAQNNVFYVRREDSIAHDILLCVKDNVARSVPVGKGRNFRFGFPNDEYYFKTPAEMAELFSDLPDTILNIKKLLARIEKYDLKRQVYLPAFVIPDGFSSEHEYLRHLALEGARKRFGKPASSIMERLEFELETIKKTGYPGYFLIVQDITSEARKMGVSVGPGRGSAAGSLVAYCTGITNVDPIEYDLLFERFLNPDRVSLPDIDIDFDDEGREKVIDFVVRKYGKNQVAQIITYGSMAAKSAIRDTARVLELPLSEADQLAKLMPDNTSLQKLLSMADAEVKERIAGPQFDSAVKLRKIAAENSLSSDVLRLASVLEGSLRNTGTHACGLIITPADMTDLIPVASAKDANLMVTQYDNSVIEDAGMLKMDFLGLKTLSIINHAVRLIRDRHGIEINVDKIPLDDAKTYALYQKGETNGTFQFESAGMQKYLKALKPDKFGDLIAMNALFRPGPMEYIPDFINRKLGKEEIRYDVPEMSEFLSETYGITVYQEQVMLLSQRLANFSKGDADVLRKAMGKKIFSLLEKLKPKFIDGCRSNRITIEIAEKIWKDWQSFAAYAFNKSHSTCYSIIAFHTAYLKANYPAEFMAAVLTNNMSDIKKVEFFMEECRRMGIKVLGPDMNESLAGFSVNSEGAIRFGLAAVKGVGESAVNHITGERKSGGVFSSATDLVSRVDSKTINKRTIESLVKAGAFDCFPEAHRAQYFAADPSGKTGIEILMRISGGQARQDDQAQMNIFGESVQPETAKVAMPECKPWEGMDLLANEKEVTGIYLTSHPLDAFRLEIASFCNSTLTALNQKELHTDRELKIAALITSSTHKTGKNNKPYGVLELEDYTDKARLFLFSDDYVKFKAYMVPGWFLFIHGKVVSHTFKPGEFDFRIIRVELLGDLREKLARSITLNIPENAIDEDFVQKLSDISRKHKGKCKLILNLLDKKGSDSLSLVSRNSMVNVSDDFLSEISEIKEMQYTIS